MEEACEGVWLPDGTVRCFVEEFRYKKDYRLSEDHIVPRSRPLGDCPGHGKVPCPIHDRPDNLHDTHRGCQQRQGGYITAEMGVGVHAPGVASRGGLIGGKVANDEEHRSDPSYREHRRRAAAIREDHWSPGG